MRRGVAVKVAEGEVTEKISLTAQTVPDYLGPQRHMNEVAERSKMIEVEKTSLDYF